MLAAAYLKIRQGFRNAAKAARKVNFAPQSFNATVPFLDIAVQEHSPTPSPLR